MCMHTKPARFAVKIFVLVFTQFLTKAGQVCDEDIFLVFPEIESCWSLANFPPLSWQKSLMPVLVPLIRFLSEALVTWQGQIKASFKAV